MAAVEKVDVDRAINHYKMNLLKKIFRVWQFSKIQVNLLFYQILTLLFIVNLTVTITRSEYAYCQVSISAAPQC